MASSLGQGRRSSALLSTLTNPRSSPMVRTDSSTSATAIEDFSDAENVTRFGGGGVDGIDGPLPNPADSNSNITFISPFASAGASQPVPIPPAFQAQKQQKSQASNAAAAAQHHHLSPVSPSSFSFAANDNPTEHRRASLAPLSESRRRSAMPPHHFPSTHSPATTAFLMDPANEERRRNSVDVASLSSAQDYRTIRKGTKRVRAARDSDHYDGQDSDADPAETSFQDQSRVSMFADHLTALLNHSLSLASGRGETSLDLYVRGKDISPVDTPSKTHDRPSSPDSAGTAGASSPGTAASPSAQSTLQQASSFSSQINRTPTIPSAGMAASLIALNHLQQFRIKRHSSQPDLTAAKRLKLGQMLSEWGFNALALDAEDLFEASSLMFEAVLRMEGIDVGVPLERIRALLLALQSAYHARNGYHNFTHATDVLQATYSFLRALELVPPLSILFERPGEPHYCSAWKRPHYVEAEGGIGQVLRAMDVFSLMVAAMGHDVGHPGLSNAYMVNAKTPVAQVYGDKSVLENFHIVTLVQMLRKHGLDHLFGAADKGPTESDGDCRKVLFASVLATDMSQHFPFVAKIQELAARPNDAPVKPKDLVQDRLLLCCGLMKCADISNPTRPHHVAKAWSTALLQEWSVQAKIEEEFKLPVSVMTLNPAEAKAQAKSQVGFINLFTQPLFDAMAAACPQLAGFARSCREGRRVWEQVVLKSEDQLIYSAPATVSSSPTAAARLEQSSTPTVAFPNPPRSSNASPSRRRSPPRPLNFGLRTRASQESTASSGAMSPSSSTSLLSPDSGVSTSASSFFSPSVVSGATKSQCIGACNLVTEKCASCMRRDLDGTKENRPEPTESCAEETFRQILTSGSTTPAEELELCDTWPPFPFYPTYPSKL